MATEIKLRDKIEFLSEVLRELNGLFARNLEKQGEHYKRTVTELYELLKDWGNDGPEPEPEQSKRAA